jgi:hypothetical protein
MNNCCFQHPLTTHKQKNVQKCSDCHPHYCGFAQCQIAPKEEQHQALLCQVQSRGALVTSSSHVRPTPLPPPSSTPLIVGLRNVESHPRKSGIGSSSAGFDPAPLCSPKSASWHCMTPRQQAALSSSCCASRLLRCFLLHCPLIVSLRQLVVEGSTVATWFFVPTGRKLPWWQ